MDITEKQVGAVLVVGLAGRLDATSSAQLEQVVLARIAGGATRLLFDLSALQYMSSAGLRVLTMALKKLAAADGRMALCGLQEAVQMVFDISGFNAYFTVTASPDEGVQQLA